MANHKPQIDEQPESSESPELIGPLVQPPVTIAIPLRWVRVTHHSADHIAARYPYAAFGSNLSLEQMIRRCPMAAPMGAGILRNARLVFATFLGIIEDSASTVPVGVYRLSAADIAALDRFEGLGRAYERYLVTVEMNGEAVRCFTYIKRDNDPLQPSERYYATCLQGYADWGFDSRRLRHARDYARKHAKPLRHARHNGYTSRFDKGFSFDDWYKATFPESDKTSRITAMGDQFIPEDANKAPHTSLVTGRVLSGRKHHRLAGAGRGSIEGQREFTNPNGEKWIKGDDGVWRRTV